MIGVRATALFWALAIFIAPTTQELRARPLAPAFNPPTTQLFVAPSPDLTTAPSSRLPVVVTKPTVHSETETVIVDQKAAPPGEDQINFTKNVESLTFSRQAYDPGAISPARAALNRDPASLSLEASSQRTLDDYRIGPEDMLKIRVYQREDLTGEFRVRTDGTISLPLLGSLLAEHKNETEIEQDIAAKIKKLTNLSPMVNVEIAQRRPFFITGDVEKPGTYPFVPGMTVKHAIAISGGIYRLSRAFSAFAVEATRENARAQEIRGKLKKVLATHARLSAALANSKTISIPPRLLEIASQEEAQALIAAEIQTMLANLAVLDNLRGSYGQEMRFGREQIVALEGQREHIEKQIQLNEARSGRLDKLFAKGLVNDARVTELHTLIARLEGESRGVDGTIAQAHKSLATAERELNQAMDRRHSSLSAEISTAKAEISTYEHALLESRKIFEQINGISASRENERQVPLRHSIMRRTGSGPQFLQGSETTPLQPGDVLEVLVERQ